MINQKVPLKKITRPNPQNIYKREKFFDVLDGCLEKSVVWISAPPGAGKTTLITSYVESRKRQCIWYQVDSGDRDPATFFHYMGIAAASCDSRIEPLPHLTPEYLLGLPAFTREYFSELSKSLKRKSLIVLDNYQEVPDESILHEAISEGQRSLSKDISIVIISRTMPPSVISRMRLSQSMEVITYDELRLTAEEVGGIASARGMSEVSDVDIRSMLSKTDGWAAGLVLMLESENKASFSNEPLDSYNAAAVFDYFADGFFQKLDCDTQKLLLKLSVLSTVTPDMAIELSGNKQAKRIISRLARRNYFIQTHRSNQINYQFHPLFLEFLYTRLKKEEGPDNLAKIEHKAARLCVDNGYLNDAIRLLRNVGDWKSMASLICKEAPLLLEQGRHQTVEGWLDCLPEQVLREVPWLLFWKACSLAPFEQGESRKFFEDAYKLFYNRKDPCGIFLSCSGIIKAIVQEFNDFKQLDHWIDVVDDLLVEYPTFSSKEVEGNMSLSMFVALSFRAPNHPNINSWVDKAFGLLASVPYSDVYVQACLSLVDYFIWTGDLQRANIIVEKLSKDTSEKSHSPYALISTKLSESLNYWYQGRLDACIATVSEGLEIAEKTGVNIFNYFLYGHGAVASLTSGDLKGAAIYLEKAASVLDNRMSFCTSYYHHIMACYNLLSEDIAGALEHEELALRLAAQVGAPFAEAMSRTGVAMIYHELGDRDRAMKEIENAHRQAVSTNSKLIELVCYMFEAHFALEGGDRNLAVQKLKKAMALGKSKGFLNFHMWRPHIVARLCMLALEEEIEVDYVKRLIRKRDVFPDRVPLEIDNWPWRIKIYVLGQFTIVKDGIPLQYSKKAPKKPLEMLKLLISLGGKDVSEDKISDTIWPDAEGDAAHVAFTTTLKRLRHLIDVDDAILLRSGSVTLNSRYCWVDVWSFNHLIDKVGEHPATAMDSSFVGLLEKAIKTYGSGFRARVVEEPWEILFYERVRDKFLRCVLMLGSNWEEAEEFEKAIECYNKGVEVEIFSEELYRKLMTCQHKLGRTAEVVGTYKRLSKACKDVLGVEPSSKTKQIYERFSQG